VYNAPMKIKYLLLLFIFSMISAHAGEAFFTVYDGAAVQNSIQDSESSAWGFEEFLPVTTNDYFGLGYMNEGHQNGSKRDAVIAEALVPYVRGNFSLFVDAGIYPTLTTVPQRSGYTDVYRTDGIFGAGIKYQMDKFSAMTRWYRVVTGNNTDADVFLVGLGYNF